MNKILLKMKYKSLQKKLSRFKEIRFNEYHWKAVDMDNKEYELISNMTVYNKEQATEDRISDTGLLLLDDDSHIPLTFIKKIWIFRNDWAVVHSIKGGFYADKRLQYYMTIEQLSEIEQEYKDVVQALEDVKKALGLIKPNKFDAVSSGETSPCSSYKEEDGMCEDKNEPCNCCTDEYLNLNI